MRPTQVEPRARPGPREDEAILPNPPAVGGTELPIRLLRRLLLLVILLPGLSAVLLPFLASGKEWPGQDQRDQGAHHKAPGLHSDSFQNMQMLR